MRKLFTSSLIEAASVINLASSLSIVWPTYINKIKINTAISKAAIYIKRNANHIYLLQSMI